MQGQDCKLMICTYEYSAERASTELFPKYVGAIRYTLYRRSITAHGQDARWPSQPREEMDNKELSSQLHGDTVLRGVRTMYDEQ